MDFKTKYQDFHVNFKPNVIYSILLKFLGLVVVLVVNFKRYTLYNWTKTGHYFLTKERWVAYVYIWKESLLRSCPFDTLIKPFSLHKLCISILKEKTALEKEVKHRDFCWLRDATCFSLHSTCLLLDNIISVLINAKL